MEDLEIFSLVFPLLIIIMVLVIIKMIIFNGSNNNKVVLPPGPWQLPLIGNMHNLLGFSLPHHILTELSNKYGPLMFLRLGTVPTLVVSSAELAEHVLKTHGVNFADRPRLLAAKIIAYDCKEVIFSPYGDYWRQLRKICAMELLSTRRVHAFRFTREDEVFNLLQSISSSSSSHSVINLSKLIYSHTYSIITRATFGGKCTDQLEEFSSLLDQAVMLFSGFSIADMYPSIKFLHDVGGFRTRVEKMHRQMDKTLVNIITAHRERINTTTSGTGELNQEYLVDVLLRIQKQRDTEIPLTDDFIKGVIFDIFMAGSETSSTTMDWAMSEMVKNRRVMERAQAEVRQVFGGRRNVDETGLDELKYFQCVIKETLRLHPPAPLLVPRENREECEINGYVIPAKSRVMVNAWAIGRDPKYWGPDANLFKPERFLDSNTSYDYKGTNFEYIPFGAGKRICPGMVFGMASMELPLAQLLYHFDWKLPDGLKHEELDMTEEFGITVRRKSNLNLIPLPYRSSFLAPAR